MDFTISQRNTVLGMERTNNLLGYDIELEKKLKSTTIDLVKAGHIIKATIYMDLDGVVKYKYYILDNNTNDTFYSTGLTLADTMFMCITDYLLSNEEKLKLTNLRILHKVAGYDNIDDSELKCYDYDTDWIAFISILKLIDVSNISVKESIANCLFVDNLPLAFEYLIKYVTTYR